MIKFIVFYKFKNTLYVEDNIVVIQKSLVCIYTQFFSLPPLVWEGMCIPLYVYGYTFHLFYNVHLYQITLSALSKYIINF